MRLTRASLALVATCVVCGHAAVGQQNDESTRATLRGIRRVVLVISFQGDTALQKFEQAPIIKDVQQRLVMAGIEITSVDQVVRGIAAGEKSAAPADYLYIYVNAAKSPVYPV